MPVGRDSLRLQGKGASGPRKQRPARARERAAGAFRDSREVPQSHPNPMYWG